MAETFGQLVRRLRKDRRLTQEQLASEAGLDQSTISAIELDKGERTVGTVSKLAGAFGAEPLDWLPLAGLVSAPAVVADPPPPSPLPPSDDGPFDAAQIVAYVKSRPGRIFQAQVAEEERRLPPDEFAAWCLDVFAAWMSNSNLALRSLRRGEQARDRRDDERT